MTLDIRLSMDDATLAPFREAWTLAGASAANDDSGQLLQAARAHHAGLAESSVPGFLRGHIDLIPEIAGLLDDPDWQVEGSARHGFSGALAYFNDPSDLIPDSQPKFGLLDDSIVIELALAEHRQEWLAWQEFAALRRRYPRLGRMDRASWAALRPDLPRALARGSDHGYVGSRFRSESGRTRYRMLDDLPRLDLR
jgi:hypothetical protein